MLEHLNQCLFLVSARSAGLCSGMVITWVTKASLDSVRPRVILVLSPRNLTTQLLLKSRRFSLSLLSKVDLDLVDRFGAKSGRDLDKFGGLDSRFRSTRRFGLPAPRTALSTAEGVVKTVASIGDRCIVVAELDVSLGGAPSSKALLMSDLRKLGPSAKARAKTKLLSDLQKDRRMKRRKMKVIL